MLILLVSFFPFCLKVGFGHCVAKRTLLHKDSLLTALSPRSCSASACPAQTIFFLVVQGACAVPTIRVPEPCQPYGSVQPGLRLQISLRYVIYLFFLLPLNIIFCSKFVSNVNIIIVPVKMTHSAFQHLIKKYLKNGNWKRFFLTRLNLNLLSTKMRSEPQCVPPPKCEHDRFGIVMCA